MLPTLLKIPESECQTHGRLPRQKWPKSWVDIEDPVVPLNEIFTDTLAGLSSRKDSSRKVELGWGKVPSWECLFCSSKNRDYSCPVYVDPPMLQKLHPFCHRSAAAGQAEILSAAEKSEMVHSSRVKFPF